MHRPGSDYSSTLDKQFYMKANHNFTPFLINQVTAGLVFKAPRLI